MSGQIKVDFSSLAELQSQVNSSAQKILTEIEDLKRTVNGTIRRFGRANAAYGDAETKITGMFH